METFQEEWKVINDFSNYRISNLGRVYNDYLDRIVKTSINNFGHVKVNLRSEWDRTQYTRSVSLLVAQSFVEAPNLFCDTVTLLDGILTNVAAYNLIWRPRWYSWKYTRQLKVPQPLHFRNLKVANIDSNIEYRNIIECGMVEGILFDEIWKSTYTGKKLFPYGHRYEITEEV